MSASARLATVVAAAVLVLPLFACAGAPSSNAPAARDMHRPALAYLKQVNEWRPPSDPQLLFLLMAEFANAGRHAEGVAYFEAALDRFGSRIENTQRALYLTALASLRAGHADNVFLLRRIGWVRDTLGLLDEANRLTGGNLFVARWMSGVVRTRLPAILGEADHAMRDLAWCEANAGRAPHPGWLREVYAGLATLHRRRGDEALAARYQAASGLAADTGAVVFTTPFTEDPVAGHTFSPRSLREVVPGTVYVLSGYEFTEYTFVVSADRRELIAIDAGTRPDAARAALQALRDHVPALPPLTTVLITHAHWDHVGGHRYFRSLTPAPTFIGRDNYGGELARGAMAHSATMRLFFGRDFSLDHVLDYRPDRTVDRPTTLTIGGTRFELLPTQGGETEDALLIHLPEHGVLFVGDVLMPYLGAPFIEEGSVDGLLAGIEQIVALQPRHLLHGHEPLTRIFSSTAMLDGLRVQLAWLRDAVDQAMRDGTERGAIHAANLMPPTLQQSASDVHLAYLLFRGNLIDRRFDQRSGYWRAGLHGLDALTDADRGDALIDYLGVSAAQLAAGAERMVADGRLELAAAVLRWAQPRFAGDARWQAVRRLTYLKLIEQHQNLDPFRFILYAGQIDQTVPPIETGGGVHPRAAASGAAAR